MSYAGVTYCPQSCLSAARLKGILERIEIPGLPDIPSQELNALSDRIDTLADDEEDRFPPSFRELWEELQRNDVSMIQDL